MISPVRPHAASKGYFRYPLLAEHVANRLGHCDIATTKIYTHVLARPDVRVVSPLDRLIAEARSVPEPKVDVGRAETEKATSEGCPAEWYSNICGVVVSHALS